MVKMLDLTKHKLYADGAVVVYISFHLKQKQLLMHWSEHLSFASNFDELSTVANIMLYTMSIAASHVNVEEYFTLDRLNSITELQTLRQGRTEVKKGLSLTKVKFYWKCP